MISSGLSQMETSEKTNSHRQKEAKTSFDSSFLALTLDCDPEELIFSDFEVELESPKRQVLAKSSTAIAELTQEWSNSTSNVIVNAYSSLLEMITLPLQSHKSLYSNDFLGCELIGKRSTHSADLYEEDLFRPEKKQVQNFHQINTPTADYFDFLEKYSTKSFCEIPDFELSDDCYKEGIETPTCDLESTIESTSEHRVSLDILQKKRLIQQKLRNIVSESFSCKAVSDLGVNTPQIMNVVEGFCSLE